MATPQGRKKNVSGTGSHIHTTGQGLGTGPVGMNSGSNQANHSGGHGGSGPQRASGGGGGLLKLILIAVVVLALGGGGLSGLFGGGGEPAPAPTKESKSILSDLISYNLSGSGSSSSSLTGLLTGVLGGSSTSGTSTPAEISGGSWSGSNTGKLDTSVVKGARAKYTDIKGNGNDKVTIMVYMCGTDLESSYGMATKDLGEMANATLSDKINLIIYTGGCKQWKTQGISNSKNQIWQMTDGGKMNLLQEYGASAMTKPENLSSFIQYCSKNFPANRNMLIFWDHGGGSLSGYGYDEKYSSSGSMTLTGINQALKTAGIKFDTIGFDACLMATAETALMLGDYADYMIASEESEPGIGWFYTNWLTNLSKNTSRSTLEIGKDIVDDFVKYCASQCKGQAATLSVVDLAELAYTVPQELKDFATSTSELLKNDQYATVSNARSGAREFAASSKIDQVDLVDLCNGMGTQESKDLAKAILGAVKYNKTSANMTNSYGLSIYFPYKKVGKVDSAVSTFEAVGMDDDYLKCIQDFASYETGGQAISGGSSSALSTLLSGYSSAGTTASSSDMISQMLSGLMGGNTYNVSGLSGLATGFLSSALGGRSLNVEDMTDYLAEKRFDPELLKWKKQADGNLAISLDQAQWDLVQDLELNLFIDDGRGYIDLGLDCTYDLDEYGNLWADYDYSWIYIEGQAAAYYHTSTVEGADGTLYYGYVPALLNDKRVELDLVMAYDAKGDQVGMEVTGFRRVYGEDETETVAKTAMESEALKAGDTLKFIADYYSYEGEYQDSYQIGEAVTLKADGQLKVEELRIPSSNKVSAAYQFKDIYGQTYWSEVQP